MADWPLTRKIRLRQALRFCPSLPFDYSKAVGLVPYGLFPSTLVRKPVRAEILATLFLDQFSPFATRRKKRVQ